MSQKYLRYDGSQWVLNNGTSGPLGPPGPPGAPGAEGPPGPTGPAGSGSGSGFIPNRNRNENYYLGQMYIGTQFKNDGGVFQENKVLMTVGNGDTRPVKIAYDNTVVSSISEESPNSFGPSLFVARNACIDLVRFDISSEHLQSIPLADSSANANISDVVLLDGYAWALDRSRGAITKVYNKPNTLDKSQDTIYVDSTFLRSSPMRLSKDSVNNRIIAVGSNTNGPGGTSPLTFSQIALYTLDVTTDIVTTTAITVPDTDVLPIDIVQAGLFYWIMYRTSDESTIKIVKVNYTTFAVVSTTTFGIFGIESDAGFSTLRTNSAETKIFTFTNDGYVYRMDTISLAIDNVGIMTDIRDLHHNGLSLMWIVGKDQIDQSKGYAYSINSTAGTMVVIDEWQFNLEKGGTSPYQPELVSITCDELSGNMYVADQSNARLWRFDGGASSGDATDVASLAGLASWTTSPTLYSGDNLNNNRTLSSNRGFAYQSKGDVIGGVNFGTKEVTDDIDFLNGDYGTIGGGSGNRAGQYAAVPGGWNNNAGATGSVAYGVLASATRAGQKSFSSGSVLSPTDFANSGKIQACEMVFSGTGTDGATGFNIELKSGPNNNQYLTLENNKSYNINFDCTAKNSASTSGQYYKKYAFVHVDGSGAITIDSQGDIMAGTFTWGSGGYTFTIATLSSPTRLGMTIAAPLGTHYGACKVTWLEI